MGYSFRLRAGFFYMHHPTDRIAHWLEREIAQWVHPMKDRSDDPSHHERTLLPRSYISLPVSCNSNALLQTLWHLYLTMHSTHFSFDCLVQIARENPRFSYFTGYSFCSSVSEKYVCFWLSDHVVPVLAILKRNVHPCTAVRFPHIHGVGGGGGINWAIDSLCSLCDDFIRYIRFSVCPEDHNKQAIWCGRPVSPHHLHREQCSRLQRRNRVLPGWELLGISLSAQGLLHGLLQRTFGRLLIDLLQSGEYQVHTH